MELKRDFAVRADGLTGVLIVPFMELKLFRHVR